MSSSKHVQTGRLARLGRIAMLGPRAGVALARGALDPSGSAAAHLGETLFETLGEMKAGSLKFGQIIAQVADSLPDAAKLRLGALFSQAPRMEISALRQVLEQDLGAPIESRFASFDPEPFAAASLGQVHAARLADGTELAVKVQYPGVAEALLHDMDLLRGLSRTFTAGGLLFDPAEYFHALRETTLGELDYQAEIERLESVRQAVSPWPDLVVPRVHATLCGPRVLTLERLVGPTLHDAIEQGASLDGPLGGDQRERLGLQLVRAVLGPLCTEGVLNADAHPGNFVLLSGERLGLLDFGAVAPVSDPLRLGFCRLVGKLSDSRLPLSPSSADILQKAYQEAGLRLTLDTRRAQDYLLALSRILAPLFRGPHDFGVDPILLRVGKLKQERPIDTLSVRFDPQMMPLPRAMLGLHHGLLRLKVTLDLRPLWAELVELGLKRPVLSSGSPG